MSPKIIIILSMLALLLFGSVLAQTNAVNKQTNSNITANSKRSTNMANTNSNRLSTSSTSLATPNNEVKSIACQYLTESDAADIFGKQMIYYTSSTYEKELKCIYMPPKDFPFGVTFCVETFATVKQAKARIAMMVKISELVNLQVSATEIPASRIPHPKAVFGIGQTAYLATSGDNDEFIYFQKDKTFFEISVLGKTGSHFQENILKSVAKKIADNFETQNQ